MTVAVADLFARYHRNDSACWVWTGGTQSKGYGSLGDGNGGTVLAHRAVWVAIHGPIPEGMTVDHICRNKLCGRPEHLRLLSAADNKAAAMAAITHCPRGHEYTDENTIRHSRSGSRSCRECQRRWRRESEARRAAGGVAS